MNKIKFIKGDVVKIIAGNHKGKQGPITGFASDKKRVFVEGIIATKHVKPSQNEDGGIKEVPASIHISNIGILDPKNKEATSKIGYQITDGKKVRIARKSNAPVK